ncbi:hypothetical protein CFC21_100836 [Triticum aestivum]|uniref:Thaumatin-like protein n=2 Tax=Triticum aestivum TaxID=4565 RepID=A0A3B6KAM7_WHEAT|nr:hypothetical protein CFC21_100836 [Triticum aestivum]
MASSLFIIAILLTVAATDAATITVVNKCSYTVWPAAIPVGGGTKLEPGQMSTIHPPAGTNSGRIWARTGCKFDASGKGSCTTGDCGGVLACRVGVKPPASLAEYTLGTGSNADFYDISLVDGFNCPSELKVNGGCMSACGKFGTPQYCCPAPSTPATCGPTSYSRFFKGLCPDAYSYAYDDKSSTFTCAAGTNYQVTFCP